jgi:ureidoacrylate peracid hydrolase
LLKPSRTALVIVDVQNDFCSPEGATAKSGRSVTACMEIIPRLNALLDGARASGVKVIFVKAIGTHATDSEAWSYRASDRARLGNCREGTWGAELYEVSPLDGETVVVKHRNSGFYNTELDTILRAKRIDTVVVVGVATNISVEMTARDAVQHDYNLVLVDDCCGAFEQSAHDGTVSNIRSFYGVVASSDEVLRLWPKL